MVMSTEAEILRRVLQPEQGDLAPDAARALLGLDFADDDHRQMAELSAKAQEGVLTPAERERLEGYINVSHLIAFIQSKARLSLKRQGIHAA